VCDYFPLSVKSMFVYNDIVIITTLNLFMYNDEASAVTPKIARNCVQE